jgi:hypothetical protein
MNADIQCAACIRPLTKGVNGLDASMAWFIFVNPCSSAAKRLFLVHTGTVVVCKPERVSETSCYILPEQGNDRETPGDQDTPRDILLIAGSLNLTPTRETGALTMKMQAIRSVHRGIVVAITAAAIGPLTAMAAEDYTRSSNEELVQQRSLVQNLGEADRLREREAMQQRAQNMTAEERSGVGRDAAADQTTQTRERVRTSEDNDRGQGELKRERERAEQHDAGSYGRGYESRQGGSGTGSAGGFSGRGAGGGGRGR